MAAHSDDLRLFYSSIVGKTYLLGLDTTSRQIEDAVGALPRGKYLVQILGLGTNRCFVKVGKFVKGSTLTAAATAFPAAGAGTTLADEFVLDGTDGITSFTFHVRNADNARIAAILSAGTATMVITKAGE